MLRMKQRGVIASAWALSVVVCLLAVIAWGQVYEGFELATFTDFRLFPLFGLLAFSLMWAHYVVGAIRRAAGVEKEPLKHYFKVTGWAALIFILLHPSLLIAGLWLAGLGFPPGSYLEYVGISLQWAATFGTLAFLTFLAFETKRWFEQKNWWPIIEYAQIIAMFAIVAHALALGANLQQGWYRTLWLWYALVLAVCIGYIQIVEAIKAHKEGKLMKKVIAIIVVMAVLVGGGWLVYGQLNKDEQPVEETSTVIEEFEDAPETETETIEGEVFTVAEVATHDNSEDCWTIIRGSVYDITDFIASHPGGSEILRACGIDATTHFTQRQDADGRSIGSGTPHSSSAASQLEQFKIGVIAE